MKRNYRSEARVKNSRGPTLPSYEFLELKSASRSKKILSSFYHRVL